MAATGGRGDDEGSLQAKRDPSFDAVRVDGGFSLEFPGAEASATEVTLNLTLAGTMAVNRVEELLAQYGLVLKSFNVLAVVGGAGQAITPTTIAGRTFIGKTTVTSVLESLERRGLVRRYPHPTNRRSVLVEVTEAGRRTCDEVLARLHVLETGWLRLMPEADRQTLVELLGLAKGLFARAHVPPRPQPPNPDHDR